MADPLQDIIDQLDALDGRVVKVTEERTVTSVPAKPAPATDAELVDAFARYVKRNGVPSFLR